VCEGGLCERLEGSGCMHAGKVSVGYSLYRSGPGAVLVWVGFYESSRTPCGRVDKVDLWVRCATVPSKAHM